MRDNGCVVVALSHLDCAESLGERTDLVYFHEDRVCATVCDTFLKILHVGYEQVVAYKLATVADEVGKDLPAFPVILVHTVLDRVDRIFGDKFLEILGLLLACELLAVNLLGSAVLEVGVVIHTVLIEL